MREWRTIWEVDTIWRKWWSTIRIKGVIRGRAPGVVKYHREGGVPGVVKYHREGGVP